LNPRADLTYLRGSGDVIDRLMETDMNRLITVGAAAALTLAGAAGAFAQDRPAEGARGFGSIARLCAMDPQWTTERMAERLARRLNLNDQQKPALKDLQDAVAKAKSDAKAVLCGSAPDLSTLPARLSFAQKRLQARLDGMKAVQPKLEALYSGLSGEQQAELNQLWRHRGMRWRGEGGGRGEGRWRGGEGGWRGGQHPDGDDD